MRTEPWTTLALTCLIFIQQYKPIDSFPSEDKITILPGQPNVSFQQYAGYVSVDEIRQRSLFYYFVEAQSDSVSTPLVLWLNGGPGCSSLGGAFSEHGPFHPRGDGTLLKNYYSWNKVANMLYLESPAGVGFSYSANTSFYNSVNDTITAQDNLMFLQNWFVKFPEYKDRDFYISGESYAGIFNSRKNIDIDLGRKEAFTELTCHYVPQLAQLIVQSGLNFNLKGIALGNPLLDFDSDSYAEGEFHWSHGLISDATYKLLQTTCNFTEIWRATLTGNWTPACQGVNDQINSEIPMSSLDLFDVTADSCLSTTGPSQLGISNRDHPLSRRYRPLTPFSSMQKDFTQSEGAESIDICVQNKSQVYLNRKDVQKALHALLIGVSQWEDCSSIVQYQADNFFYPTIGILGSLVRSGIRALIYSGDVDSRVPVISSRSLVNGLAKELGFNASSPYKPWFDQDKQVGGWTQAYGNNSLSYVTIRGGSHMVPWSSPKRSLQMFTAFLAAKTLA